MAPFSLASASELLTPSGGRHALRPSSFRQCPAPKPKGLAIQAPACLEGGKDCATTEERAALRSFAEALDDSLEEPLQQAKAAREGFERRVCDFRYAEIEDKSQILADTYGPYGPMEPGGSYLYELRRWSQAIIELDRACSQTGGEACSNFLSHMRNYPDADLGPGGSQGAVGSDLYNEIRLACEVGKTRAPVPNESPVWCDSATGLCERKSCRSWWRDAHPLAVNPKPWVDDRAVYDQLKQACTNIERSVPKDAELNAFQGKLETTAVALRGEYCHPKWVDGYCKKKAGPEILEECTLPSGQYCKKGNVKPGSASDITSTWSEGFKEHSSPQPLVACLL
eukprot:CAMPEP_0197636352 /NCGR_PEP_ID=MMETSP1338-20131121/11884_1 /TAXON_ID=43686 ORGANISM="Pelagodinium beii, Strain RCC1491" /NCGR_SAMPLE_ID=MMETSP1338 /ASSEMBLY_ACC=CAM_ASM_000754 /LENGTH=339 /DNA_ID=CAMNT_0043208565 /DNA_START=73 /DNA_END=1089 /DNA_ORIENTATION=-